MSAGVSRRGVMLLGGWVATSSWGVPLRAVTPRGAAVAPTTWYLADGASPTAQAWLRSRHLHAAAQPFVIGGQDLYAWWRQASHAARTQGQPLQVQGLTRWGEFSFLQACAREAGLRAKAEALQDQRQSGRRPATSSAPSPSILVSGQPWPIDPREPSALLVSWQLT